MTKTHRAFLQPAIDTLSWAKDAIDDLEADAHAFFKADIPVIREATNTVTGRTTVSVYFQARLPLTLQRRAIEALEHTKNSFDQILSGFHRARTGQSKRFNYPWAQDSADLETRLKNKKFDLSVLSLIRSQAPYPKVEGRAGVSKIVRSLATLTNDKHSIGVKLKSRPDTWVYPKFRCSGEIDIRMAPVPEDNRNREIELVSYANNVELEGDFEFYFWLGWDAKEPLNDVDVILSLREFHKFAKLVLDDFRAAL